MPCTTSNSKLARTKLLQKPMKSAIRKCGMLTVLSVFRLKKKNSEDGLLHLNQHLKSHLKMTCTVFTGVSQGERRFSPLLECGDHQPTSWDNASGNDHKQLNSASLFARMARFWSKVLYKVIHSTSSAKISAPNFKECSCSGMDHSKTLTINLQMCEVAMGHYKSIQRCPSTAGNNETKKTTERQESRKEMQKLEKSLSSSQNTECNRLSQTPHPTPLPCTPRPTRYQETLSDPNSAQHLSHV